MRDVTESINVQPAASQQSAIHDEVIIIPIRTIGQQNVKMKNDGDIGMMGYEHGNFY